MNLLRTFYLKEMFFLLSVATFLLANSKCFASFKLESTGIILEEKERRVSFNVMNTSKNPILLVTKLEDLDDKKFSKNILISPPIVRINAGQSQHVNFVLKNGVQLNSETLLKTSFEGVEQKNSQSATMPIRQNIGFLVVPASGKQTREPWTGLKITNLQNSLIIKNESQSVIRLGPQIKLLPGQNIYNLDRLFILPGESKEIPVQISISSIEITPLSRYGLKLPAVEINAD